MDKRRTIADIMAHKGGTPLVCLTAPSAPFAAILDPYVDILLVGDSLGMTLYGMETTLPVKLDMMIAHAAAVVRGSRQSCVVVDLPFGSYQESPQQAFRSAARVLKESGAAAVKLEGGSAMAETVRFLTMRGIPVMGHVGLLPQSVHALGGYRVRGAAKAEYKTILADAAAIEQAGAFCLVVEHVVESLAREITSRAAIPTIGIGASPACDGQVLVTEDMAGLYGDAVPRFVKLYGRLRETLDQAARRFSTDVRTRKFPEPAHCLPTRGKRSNRKPGS